MELHHASDVSPDGIHNYIQYSPISLFWKSNSARTLKLESQKINKEMKRIQATVFLMTCTVLMSFGQSTVSFLTEELTINSSILKEDRKLTVYKPQKVEGPLSIIYLFDGEWNFEVTTGIVDYFIRWSRIPSNVAVVAVHNQGTRTLDLTPIKDDNRFPGSGGGKIFLSFLEQELIPFVEKEIGESADRLLIGHSFGGLFALYTLFEKPTLFDGCIAISPSTWYGDNLLSSAEFLEKLKKIDERKFLFITSGQYDRGNAVSNKQYVDWIKENTPDVGLDMHYNQNLGRNHFSNVVTSTDEGLSKYFPGPELIEDIESNFEEGGINQLKLWHDKKSMELGNRFVTPDGSILSYAGKLNAAKRNDEALELLLWYKNHAPENGNFYYYIGVISQDVGNIEQAKEHYEHALSKNLPERIKTVISRRLENIVN